MFAIHGGNPQPAGEWMDQRLSLITLGVGDLARLPSPFYEALGMDDRRRDTAHDVVFFQAGGMIVALWDRAKLAEDSGFSRMTRRLGRRSPSPTT